MSKCPHPYMSEAWEQWWNEKLKKELAALSALYKAEDKHRKYLEENRHFHMFNRDRVCEHCGITMLDYHDLRHPKVCVGVN